MEDDPFVVEIGGGGGGSHCHIDDTSLDYYASRGLQRLICDTPILVICASNSRRKKILNKSH